MAREAETPGPGHAEEIAPGVRRVLAPNPGPMTYRGTNSYIVGAGRVAVIDPGPDDPRHRAALLAALEGRRVEAVLVTHAHLDHSGGTRAFAAAAGAPVLAFGGPEAGRSAVMTAFARRGAVGGGEGVDRGFRPDETLADGDALDLGGARLTALHTPGHFGGHLAFALDDLVFTGDLVMGWSTTLISPPDGDVADFLASCARLLATGARRGLPGHGTSVEDLPGRIAALIAHRRSREAEIIATLARGPETAAGIAALVYADLDPSLLPAAARNVLAHLADLEARGRVSADTEPPARAVWHLS